MRPVLPAQEYSTEVSPQRDLENTSASPRRSGNVFESWAKPRRSFPDPSLRSPNETFEVQTFARSRNINNPLTFFWQLQAFAASILMNEKRWCIFHDHDLLAGRPRGVRSSWYGRHCIGHGTKGHGPVPPFPVYSSYSLRYSGSQIRIPV